MITIIYSLRVFGQENRKQLLRSIEVNILTNNFDNVF